MSPEWRAILLTDHHDHVRVGLRDRMRAAALGKVLPVHDAVVLAGGQRVDDIQILGAPHHHHVFERVPQVSAVIHVAVSCLSGSSYPGSTNSPDPSLACDRPLVPALSS